MRPGVPVPDPATGAGEHAGFSPTRDAALARLRQIDPHGYAARRNFLDGPVTRLSPYLTHGIIDLPEAVAAARARGAGARDKLVLEFAWREYWQHVWRHLGVGILSDIRRPIARVGYRRSVPRDVLAARSGVPVVDATVRALYRDGYVHNHARMWLASYLVHLRKTHWRAGADWLYGYLLDGDLGSNHLSWQWVAGTFHGRPYLFNDANVARHAPALARTGTAIDAAYAEIERVARSCKRLGPERDAPPNGVRPPALLATPPAPFAADPLPEVAGRDVALVHPWSLGPRLSGGLALGVIHAPFHQAFPWSEARWRFVVARLREVTDAVWIGDLNALVPQLSRAARVTAVATPNPGYRDALGQERVALVPPRRQFGDPDELCESFSHFWRRVAPAPEDRAWRSATGAQ